MKNVSLAMLFIAAVFLGALAWWQSQQIAQLEQRAASVAVDHRVLQYRLNDTERRIAGEKSRTEAEAPLTSFGKRQPPALASNSEVATAQADGRAALNNPAIQKATAITIKTSLDQRYGGLFRQLKLNAAEFDKFKDLLTERQMGSLDIIQAAVSQGLVPSRSSANNLLALMGKAQTDVDENIRSLLGDQRFQQYQDFNQNIASYTLLDEIERRLSYTNAPLQESQSAPLLRALVETIKPPSAALSASSSFAQSLGRASPFTVAMTTSMISDETVAQAQTVLTPAQTEVLRKIQAEQHAQVNMVQSLLPDAASSRQSSAGAPADTPAPDTPAPTG